MSELLPLSSSSHLMVFERDLKDCDVVLQSVEILSETKRNVIILSRHDHVLDATTTIITQ